MKNSTYLALGLTIVAVLGLGLPAPFGVRLAAATLLAFFLPGWFLLRLAGPVAGSRVEQVMLAAGLSYGLTVLGALGLLYARGYLSTLWLAGLLGLIIVLLAAACLKRANFIDGDRPGDGQPDRLEGLFMAIPMAVAIFFSFTNLGYSDYWGDEMNGLLRALSIIEGRPETLFEHTKGPVEVLLPAVFGLLVGRFEPFTLRFPFALAHVIGIGGFYLLGQRLFNRQVGLLAALILALNGLYLTFGRIVQYQAVVFLMTSLSLLLVYHYYQQGAGFYLVAGSFLVGVGLLAHYDMLLVLPPLVYLVWRRESRRQAAWRDRWPGLVGPAILLLAVVALFYVPFLLHPHLEKTSSYLARIIGASDWPGNNFDELYIFAVMYNSRYYVVFITLLGGGLVAGELGQLFRQRYADRRLWLAIIAALMLGLLALALGRPSFIPVLAFALLFVLLVGFSAGPPQLKMVYGWLGVSFVGYVFFIDHPRTHLQIIYPGWSLLVAVALVGLATRLRDKFTGRPQRWLALGAVVTAAVLFGFFATYQYLLFVDARREYIFTYPAHTSPLFWEDANFPFGSRRLYGAPHRLGWQMIHQLYAQGDLQGDWDSNDDGSNLFWYTLGAPRNACYPRYYFLTQFEQREGEPQESPSFNQTDYARIGQIWNNNRLQIDIYEFAPQGLEARLGLQTEPARYASLVRPENFYTLPFEDPQPRITHVLPNSPLFRPSPEALARIAGHYDDPRITEVRDTVALIGYDLSDAWAEPGGVALVTLYWQAAEVVNLPYKIFVHLESAGSAGPQVWTQADDFPACGTRPTQRWPVGETIADRHLLRLPADMPPGDYVLRVGLYEPQTGLRMDLLDVMQNPQGNSFELGRLVVRSAT